MVRMGTVWTDNQIRLSFEWNGSGTRHRWYGNSHSWWIVLRRSSKKRLLCIALWGLWENFRFQSFKFYIQNLVRNLKNRHNLGVFTLDVPSCGNCCLKGIEDLIIRIQVHLQRTFGLKEDLFRDLQPTRCSWTDAIPLFLQSGGMDVLFLSEWTLWMASIY